MNVQVIKKFIDNNQQTIFKKTLRGDMTVGKSMSIFHNK